MKTKSLHRTVLKTGLAATLGITLGAASSFGTPYATCLTNDAGVISFRLNESADNVKVIWNGGATTNDIGAVSKGLIITNLGVTGVYKIQVTKTGSAGYTDGVVNQISDDANDFVKFANGRGLAINRRPGSPYFGRIYVALGSAGTANGRATGDGIYVLNPDQTDAVGQGNTALNGGINFGTSAENPTHINVGKDDDRLYITDWSDTSGGVYVTDPDVSPGSGTNVLYGLGGPFPVTSARIHGSASGVWAEGSTASNNLTLWTIDEDLQEDRDDALKFQVNSLWRYDIGGATLPYSNWPATRLISPGTLGAFAQYSGVRRGPDGKFYILQRRANNANTAGAFVVSEDGTTQLWDSITASRDYLFDPTAFDLWNETRGIDVSADGKLMVTINGNTNALVFVRLVNGVPDMAAGFWKLGVTPTTAIGRDVAFDIAGNVYSLSSGQGLLRIYSPGGYRITTTGSDGTFDLFTPEITTFVSVTADIPSTAEGGAVGSFTITRTAPDLSQPLPVRFATSGTAVNGVDYNLRTNSVNVTNSWVIIPAGANTVTVEFAPIDDSVAEFTETATFGLSSTATYGTTPPASASIDIADNETPTIDLALAQGSVFEGLTNDYARFQLTRRGDLTPMVSVNISYGGTAAPSRHSGPTTAAATFNFNDVNVTFDVHPVNDTLLQGNQTIVANIASGTGYVIGTNGATATIVDDEVLPETVIYQENFNTDNSANWTLKFGSINDISDYRMIFNYDYSSGFMPLTGGGFPILPPAPKGTGTTGLYMTANKDESSALGAAAVNMYLNSPTFSGDFAVRFDMYLMVGDAASTTEYALFGINHSGNATNWFRNTAGGITNGTYDGLFYGVEADGAALGDYVIYSTPAPGATAPLNLTPGVNASSLTSIFKVPPYAFGGAPGNSETSLTPSWSQVEISQVGRYVRLKINNTPIMSYSNTTAYTSGKLMLGYTDAYDSIMAGNSCVIYDNLRVVAVNPPNIVPALTTLSGTGNTNVTVRFTFGLNDAPAVFKLQKANTVSGPYADVTATLTQEGPGVYTATTTRTAAETAAFYRVRYAP